MSDTTVAASLSAWLQSTALFTSANDPQASAWGASKVDSSISSPLAFKADAVAEAVRQLAFLGQPLAVDEHIVIGALSALIGRAVPIIGDRLGYEATPTVFVIGAVENDNGTTTLTVLNRLGNGVLSVPANVRITIAGDTRIAEDGGTRIVE